MKATVFIAAILGLAVAVACTTETKKGATKTALDVQSTSQRRDTFEATARALDERPEDIDLFYSVARRHPVLMERFVEDATKDLASEDMADLVARHVVEKPDSLETTMKVTLRETAKRPPARRAMDRAIASEAHVVNDIMTDDSWTVGAVVSALLDTLDHKPRARAAVVQATEKERARILAFAKENPKLAKEVAEQVIREEVKDKPTAEKLLRSANIIDDAGMEKAKTAH